MKNSSFKSNTIARRTFGNHAFMDNNTRCTPKTSLTYQKVYLPWKFYLVYAVVVKSRAGSSKSFQGKSIIFLAYLDLYYTSKFKSKPRRDRGKQDVCANHNYGTEENLIKAVRRYLRCMGSWSKL
jgi:hypothetical protein